MTDQETMMTAMNENTAIYAAAQLNEALDTTEQHIYAAAGDDGVDDVFVPFRTGLSIDAGRSYTAGDFSAMLNAVANEWNGEDTYEDSDTIWEDTVVNLLVNCAGYLLEHPGASLEEVIAHAWADLDGDINWPEQYDGTPEDELPAKGTPERNEAIVNTVLGWVS
jgi:hypothetical protein